MLQVPDLQVCERGHLRVCLQEQHSRHLAGLHPHKAADAICQGHPGDDSFTQSASALNQGTASLAGTDAALSTCNALISWVVLLPTKAPAVPKLQTVTGLLQQHMRL